MVTGELRLVTRFLVGPITYMMMKQRTRTIISPKLIATFVRLEKKLKRQLDCKDAKLYHFIG